jgi:hypothetical protein
VNQLSELISRLQAGGGQLGLQGDRVTVKYPRHCKEALSPLLDTLRENRVGLADLLRARSGSQGLENQPIQCQDAEDGLTNRESVASVLRQNAAASPMPPHIRLVEWNPKEAPIAIDTCSVVVDVPQFIKTTLEQLSTALTNHKRWVGWSVPQLADRLQQAGVVVEWDGPGRE